MTVINDTRKIETVLTPSELNFFRTNVPRFLDYINVLQTQVTQISIRVGGSGSGTDIPDLDELTGEVSDLSDLVAAQEQDALIASLTGRIAELEKRLHAIESDFSVDTRALDAIEELRRDTPIDRYQELLSRIQALEAQL